MRATLYFSLVLAVSLALAAPAAASTPLAKYQRAAAREFVPLVHCPDGITYEWRSDGPDGLVEIGGCWLSLNRPVWRAMRKWERCSYLASLYLGLLGFDPPGWRLERRTGDACRRFQPRWVRHAKPDPAPVR